MKGNMTGKKTTWSSEQIPDEMVEALAEAVLKAMKDYIASEDQETDPI